MIHVRLETKPNDSFVPSGSDQELLAVFRYFSLCGAQQTGHEADKRAIRLLIKERENAWNTGDVARYGQLLIWILTFCMSSSARVFIKGGTTATPIEPIRFLRADVAIVNTRFLLTGLRAADGSTLQLRRGLLTLVVTKEPGGWLIASMRGVPESPIR